MSDYVSEDPDAAADLAFPPEPPGANPYEKIVEVERIVHKSTPAQVITACLLGMLLWTLGFLHGFLNQPTIEDLVAARGKCGYVTATNREDTSYAVPQMIRAAQDYGLEGVGVSHHNGRLVIGGFACPR